jgi:hypothetical protein
VWSLDLLRTYFPQAVICHGPIGAVARNVPDRDERSMTRRLARHSLFLKPKSALEVFHPQAMGACRILDSLKWLVSGSEGCDACFLRFRLRQGPIRQGSVIRAALSLTPSRAIALRARLVPPDRGIAEGSVQEQWLGPLENHAVEIDWTSARDAEWCSLLLEPVGTDSSPAGVQLDRLTLSITRQGGQVASFEVDSSSMSEWTYGTARAGKAAGGEIVQNVPDRLPLPAAASTKVTFAPSRLNRHIRLRSARNDGDSRVYSIDIQRPAKLGTAPLVDVLVRDAAIVGLTLKPSGEDELRIDLPDGRQSLVHCLHGHREFSSRPEIRMIFETVISCWSAIDETVNDPLAEAAEAS